MATSGRLRRVTVAGLLAAFGAGRLSVAVVVLGQALRGPGGAGAALVAAFGLGNLLGSLVFIAFLVRGSPSASPLAGSS
jgi:hypothetical protein